jgi:quercetin dioxygenase-like cupin family protein
VIRLQLDRIAPGAEVGPHRHGVETIVYVASGEIVFEHGEDLERRVVVGAGDVLYEAPAEYHLVRNEGTVDALALLAAVDVDPRRTGEMLLRWDSDAEPVARRADGRLAQHGPVHLVQIVGPGDFGSATFSVGEVEIDPGGATEWHRHPTAEHAIVVFEGRGVITVDGTTETLEPLTGIRIDAGLAHHVENTGRGPLRYYVCASPGTDPLVDREPVEPPARRLDA